MMKTTSLVIASVAGVAFMANASLVLAQAKPAAPAKPAAAPAAAPASPITVNIPGVCVLSREGLVGASTVGHYVQTRLGQLSTQTNAELTAEQTSLQNDAKALEAKKATLAAPAYQQQRASLQQRAEALQQKAQLRDRELQTTEQKAIARILQEAGPLVSDQVKAKGCGVLLDANSVLAANPAMDLTPSVVTALNGKLTQFDFDRERLDAPGAAPPK